MPCKGGVPGVRRHDARDGHPAGSPRRRLGHRGQGRFLDRIATHVLAFEADGVVRWFEGNFAEYEEFRHRELGVAADRPHRIRYKGLAG